MEMIKIARLKVVDQITPPGWKLNAWAANINRELVEDFERMMEWQIYWHVAEGIGELLEKR